MDLEADLQICKSSLKRTSLLLSLAKATCAIQNQNFKEKTNQSKTLQNKAPAKQNIKKFPVHLKKADTQKPASSKVEGPKTNPTKPRFENPEISLKQEKVHFNGRCPICGSTPCRDKWGCFNAD